MKLHMPSLELTTWIISHIVTNTGHLEESPVTIWLSTSVTSEKLSLWIVTFKLKGKKLNQDFINI